MRAKLPFLALLMVTAMGCPSNPEGPTSPTATTAPIDTAAPTVSAQPTGVLEPTAECAPWAPSPRTLVVRSGGGRGDFFREFQYDFGTGAVKLHDSDPFADGKEAKDPRVLQQDKKLTGKDKSAVDDALVAICPDDAAMKAACAPGGCSRLVVKRGDGSETTIEHAETVNRVMKLFSPHFTELRTQ